MDEEQDLGHLMPRQALPRPCAPRRRRRSGGWDHRACGRRIAANLRALRVLAELERDERPATAAERELLAQWSSSGAVPVLFDDPVRSGPRSATSYGRCWLMSVTAGQARRTTITRPTPTQIAAAMSALAGQLGFTGGRLLEPGCRAACSSAWHRARRDDGVELDDTTAAIAQQLHPERG